MTLKPLLAALLLGVALLATAQPTPAAPGATAPSVTDRLDRMEAATTRHADAARARIGAIKAFYTGLDPHQKQLFDALMRMRHGGGMARDGMGHHGMGGGRGGGMGDHLRGGHPSGPGPMGGPAATQGCQTRDGRRISAPTVAFSSLAQQS